MDVTYANTTGVPPSLSGSKYYVADEVHFSSQDCNVTADTLLNVCCKVKFKEGFDFDGDICDLDGDAIFQGFTAKRNTGFGFCDELAQCGALGNPSKALIGLGSSSGHISTQLQATSSTGCVSVSGSVTILNPCAAADTALGNSIKIAGGAGVNKDVSIVTTETGADINLTSSDNISLTAQEWDAKLNLAAGTLAAGYAIQLPPSELPTSTANTTRQQASRVLYPANGAATGYTDDDRYYILGGNGDTNPGPPAGPQPGTLPPIPTINSNPYGRRIDRVNTKRTNVFIYPRSTNPPTWPVPRYPTNVWPGDQRGDIIYAYTDQNNTFNNIISYMCIKSYDGLNTGDYWWRLRKDSRTNSDYASAPNFYARW